MNYTAILAGGEGSRLSANGFKPLAQIGDKSLLQISLSRLLPITDKSLIILFNERGKDYNLHNLPELNNPQINYFYAKPPTSLHSMFNIFQKIPSDSGSNHLMVSMIDTIMLKDDFKKFTQFCQTLKPYESAIVTTTFIDDEKPLTLKIDHKNLITKFQVPLETLNVQVTSGIYCFSYQALKEIGSALDRGVQKMRNYLTWLVDNDYPIYAFSVNKTVDVDRPEDILEAQKFIKDEEI